MEGIFREETRPMLIVPCLTDEHIADAAHQLRVRYYEYAGEEAGSRILPQNVIWDFLDPDERVSLDIESSLGRTKEGTQIAGQMIVCDKGGKIKIDSAMALKSLYPFTLSHEIGHWVLHRLWVLQWLLALRAFGDTTTQFLTLNRNVGQKLPTQVTPVEWQANRFAVHFLTPSDLVDKEFRRRFGRVSRRYSDLPASSSLVATTSLMEYSRFMAHGAQSSSERSMAQVFGISVECMAIRLQELQLV